MRTLITDGVFTGVESLLMPLIGTLQLDLTIASSPEEARAALPDTQLLFVKNFPLRSEDLRSATRLLGVQRLGMMTDTVDVKALAARRIPFRTMRLPSAVAVADHTITLMLALARQLEESRLAMRSPTTMEPITTDERRFAYNWAGLSATALTGKSLGLIGFGEVALEVAHRARAFGMHVVYTKRVRLPQSTERRLGIRFTTLDSLLAASDVVSIHVPHTPETVGLIGAVQLASMKPGAKLINTARGAIVDEAALVESLKAGRLGGAGLDVFTIEPLPLDSPLLTAPRTVLTPHTAGAGSAALARAIAEKLARWRRALRSSTRTL